MRCSGVRAAGVGARRRGVVLVSTLVLLAGLLAACSSASAKPVLTWYINPDTGGQDAVAQRCSTNEYTISTQVLPTDAGQQRIQLARRLAARDSSIDLMSIDPPYTAEFANAGYLAPIPADLASTFTKRSFRSAVAAAVLMICVQVTGWFMSMPAFLTKDLRYHSTWVLDQNGATTSRPFQVAAATALRNERRVSVAERSAGIGAR